MVGIRLSIAALCLLLVAPPAWGANILGLFTSHSQSHLILHMSMIKTLAESGHNVTVVSMVQPTVMHKDIHLIVIPMPEEQEKALDNQMKEMAGQKNSVFNTMTRLLSGMGIMIESQLDLLSHPRFQRIYETKFDLMFIGYFINDFQLGVAAKLKVPVIFAWMQAPMTVIDDLIGNPKEISYVPIMGTALGPGERMGFFKRAQNFGMDLMIRSLFLVFKARSTSYYERQFGNEPKDFPTLEEMQRNISLVFTHSHLVSEGFIRPLVPGCVEIGGIQIKEQPDSLPEDIAQFLEGAKHGGILLSLGSNIKSTAVKPELVQSMFKVLSGLKQRVIWKWEDLDNTPGKSANILYKKWLPQDDILAHPNIKLFITHAGKGGITEARYHAVPMVALPIFGDQPTNAATMQKSGYGLTLDLLQLNEENFKAHIEEVLGNEKYALAISRFSQLYRDRPVTAKQSVVYWTEYVLRHKGAPHLQSPAVHMTTVAYNNLDVYAALSAVLITALFLTWLVVKWICRKLCGKSKKEKKVKKH
ncbi:UDP-glycosyltransferase UGT5 [Drosophila grimshawi]|uniref:GH11566 n=1 Tax=Drosophila grimshawi TaxID=7222 RepID=B4JBJ7_DROGR|nr:UDP-glycosyltransferase UGT5 [Drosophila grimshawi]EDW04020.1 GH11566 [Drosophila grimshawi]